MTAIRVRTTMLYVFPPLVNVASNLIIFNTVDYLHEQFWYQEKVRSKYKRSVTQMLRH